MQGAGRQVITVGIGRAGDDSPFELGILVHIHIIDTGLFGHAGVITGRLPTAVRSVSTFRPRPSIGEMRSMGPLWQEIFLDVNRGGISYANSSRRTITPVGL